MKRVSVIVITVICLAFSLTASAQIRLGAIGGLNFSTMEPAADEEIAGRTVMGFGCVFNIGIIKNLDLRIEPMYLQKYACNKGTATQPAIDLELAFFEIPLLLKYTVGTTVRPYIIAGPSFGYLLKSEFKTNTGGFESRANIRDILQQLDLSMGVGAGIDVPIGPIAVFVEGRYTWALRNINKGGIVEFVMGSLVYPIEIESSDVMKSRGLQLMTGILIPL